MWLEDYFNLGFDEFYTNPWAVALALFGIVFILSFFMLSRLGFAKKNQGAIVVISICIGLLFFYRFRELNQWVATFNILLILAVILVGIKFLLLPFLRFLGIISPPHYRRRYR